MFLCESSNFSKSLFLYFSQLFAIHFVELLEESATLLQVRAAELEESTAPTFFMFGSGSFSKSLSNSDEQTVHERLWEAVRVIRVRVHAAAVMVGEVSRCENAAVLVG